VNFGPVVEEPEAHLMMDASREVGINFVGTANTYGGSTRRGRTEEIVGTWFSKGGGRREGTVLATKVYEATGAGPNEGGLSALNIRRAPVIGPRNLQQLESAVRAVSISTDLASLARLDKIFPGHRPAPEDYAW
jgi:NDP-hexose C3-ketoreductase / dTDP-4-oxo-2-deoxy-alpha-D-pentos-2-ene 2,3-reductase